MKRSSALALFALAIALYCLLPFLWFVLTSFKSPAELAAIPPKLVPSFHWEFLSLGTVRSRLGCVTSATV